MGADETAVVEALDRARCLRLLAPGGVGRLGLTSGALPVVCPVAFALDGDRIVAGGLRLDVSWRDAAVVVAFQADRFDPRRRSGWSVSVTGLARELGDDHADRWDWLLAAWPVGPGRLVVVSTEIVTGQRTGGGRPGSAPATGPAVGRLDGR